MLEDWTQGLMQCCLFIFDTMKSRVQQADEKILILHATDSSTMIKFIHRLGFHSSGYSLDWLRKEIMLFTELSGLAPLKLGQTIDLIELMLSVISVQLLKRKFFLLSLSSTSDSCTFWSYISKLRNIIPALSSDYSLLHSSEKFMILLSLVSTPLLPLFSPFPQTIYFVIPLTYLVLQTQSTAF